MKNVSNMEQYVEKMEEELLHPTTDAENAMDIEENEEEEDNEKEEEKEEKEEKEEEKEKEEKKEKERRYPPQTGKKKHGITVSKIATVPSLAPFQLLIRNVDVSFINSIRRTIVSSIPVIGFGTSDEDIVIHQNVTKLTNEQIRHRMHCVPIHSTDCGLDRHPVDKRERIQVMNDNYKHYIVRLNVSNDDPHQIRTVTTQDLKIFYRDEDKGEEEEEVNALRFFPPDLTTGDFIELFRLQPHKIGSLSDELWQGGSIELEATLGCSNANVNGCFAVASICFHENEPDEDLIESKRIAWQAEQGGQNEDRRKTLADFMHGEAKRYFKPNCFLFHLESASGAMSEWELFQAGIEYTLFQVYQFMETLQRTFEETDFIHSLIKPTVSVTLQNAFDVQLVKDVYTVGYMLQYMILTQCVQKKGDPKGYGGRGGGEETARNVTYCGVQQNHPHDKRGVLRIGFAKDQGKMSKEEVLQLLITQTEEVMRLLVEIQDAFQGCRDEDRK